jgi:hypothetical protein
VANYWQGAAKIHQLCSTASLQLARPSESLPWVVHMSTYRTPRQAAKFTGFGGAFSIECCGGSSAIIEDSLFTLNRIACSGYGAAVTFRRCEFSHHDYAAIIGGNIAFETCNFRDQPKGAAAAGSTFRGCVFSNHAEIAVSGGSVYESLFVNNSIAVSYDGSGYGPYVSNSIILHSLVGVQAGQGATVVGGWICGVTGVLQTDSTSELIAQVFSNDISATGVWFGASSDRVDLIRGSIRDMYWSDNLGLVNLDHLPDQAPAWPETLQSYYSSFASLCTEPHDRGFSSASPPSGMVMVDTIWPSGVHVISSSITIRAGVTLTIEPGARLEFTTYGSRLVVVGSLVARGQKSSPIVFDGKSAASTAIRVSAMGRAHVNISHATFTGFGGAFSIECCGGSAAIIEDSLFTLNRIACSGYGAAVTFRRCEFSHHDYAAIIGGNIAFETCNFHDQPKGAAAAGSTFRGCVFSNHAEIAVSGGSVYESLFVNNSIAVSYDGSGYGPYVSRSTVSAGRMGVLAGNGAVLRELNLCGNSEYNIEIGTGQDLEVSHTWLGTASSFLAKRAIRTPASVICRLTSVRAVPYMIPDEILPFDLAAANLNIDCVFKPCDSESACNGRGVCDSFGKCECMSNWIGDRCDTCSFGPNSLLCLQPCSEISSCNRCSLRPDCLSCASTGVCYSMASINDSLISSCLTWTNECQESGGQNILAAASISENMQDVTISFFSVTDLGGSSPGIALDCLLFFCLKTTQQLGWGSHCTFLSGSVLSIRLGTSFSPDVFRDGLLLRSGLNPFNQRCHRPVSPSGPSGASLVSFNAPYA